MLQASPDTQRKPAPLQQLDALQRRVEQLNTRRTRAQVQLETARQQHAEAVKEAERDYKTHNLDELRTRLVSLETENTKAVADFALAVEKFEQFIERIERALVDPEYMAELVGSMPPVDPETTLLAPEESEPVPQFAHADI